MMIKIMDQMEIGWVTLLPIFYLAKKKHFYYQFQPKRIMQKKTFLYNTENLQMLLFQSLSLPKVNLIHSNFVIFYTFIKHLYNPSKSIG